MTASRDLPLSEDELARYVAVVVELEGAADRDRAGILAQRGMDEERYDALVTRVHEAIDRAIDGAGDGVPELVTSLDARLRAARSRRHEQAREPMSLERYAQAVVALRSGRDPQRSLAELGLGPADLARASAYFNPRLGSDPALGRRFAELLAMADPANRSR
jgi:hypothetical protein